MPEYQFESLKNIEALFNLKIIFKIFSLLISVVRESVPIDRRTSISAFDIFLTSDTKWINNFYLLKNIT